MRIVLYAFRAGPLGPIKFGYAVDPVRRVRHLRTGCPDQVIPLGIMAGTRNDERALLSRLDRYRFRGEWFWPHAEVLEEVEKMDKFPESESFGHERRPRRTVSEQVDQSAPAFRIVQKGGGLSKFCADFDFPISTVHSWLTKRNGRGGSGLLPSRTRFVPELGRDLSYQAFIVWKGKQLDPPIDYTPEDFVEAEAI